MDTRKLFVSVLIAVLVTFLLTSVAFAGGWHKLGPKEGNAANTDNPDAGLWPSSGRIPHSNLSTSSNNCRTCHAVHNADNTVEGSDNGVYNANSPKEMGDVGLTDGTGQSFKLLRNESRGTECNFCHGTNGALSDPVKKPYSPIPDTDDYDGDLDTTENIVKGQHTLGLNNQLIPDSTVPTSSNSIYADGLSCGNCHSVHGGYTLNGITNAGSLATKILKRDPANNGDRVAGGAAGGAGNVAAQGGTNTDNASGENEPVPDGHTNTNSESEYLAAFCGDCHNKNVSWDDGGTGAEGESISGGADEGDRPNKFAHPLGNTEGLIDVYGKLDKVEDSTVDTWIDANGVGGYLSCDDCHKSRRQQSEAQDGSDPSIAAAPAVPNYGDSKFPHQSVGHKLLSDNYTEASPVGGFDYTGDPNRVLPDLDIKVCRTCHGDLGTFGGIGNPSSQDTF